jgi:ketosteroid isomerase-like protein
MNKLICGLLCLTFFYSSQVFCDETKAVSDAVNQLTKAMIDADGKILAELSAPELSYGHSGGTIEDKAAFIEKIVSGRSDFVTIDIQKQTISVVGKTAIVRHDLNADILDGGKAASIHLGVLLVWQKQSGKWKLLARQAIKYLPAPAAPSAPTTK